MKAAAGQGIDGGKGDDDYKGTGRKRKMKIERILVMVLLVMGWIFTANVTQVSAQVCDTNLDCGNPALYYCERSAGECPSQGACQLKPTNCIALYAPVCSCDGLDFTLDCEAARAGRNVNYDGTCVTCPDSDNDGACDGADNCDGYNPDQADQDGDGIGDICDICNNQLTHMVIDTANSIIHTSGGIDGQGVGDLEISGNFGLLDNCDHVYFINLNVQSIPYPGFDFPDYFISFDGLNLIGDQPNRFLSGTFDDSGLQMTGTDYSPSPDQYQFDFTILAGKDSDGDGIADDNDLCPAAFLNQCTTTYEDGEDALTTGWETHDSFPAGSTITNANDVTRDSRVIELSGSGIANAYKLQKNDGTPWSNPVQVILDFSANFSEYFAVMVHLNTTNGPRLLTYVPIDSSPLGSKVYVTYGLGSTTMNGQWHEISRDLQADLNAAQPGNTILSVEEMIIRGSGRLDDIRLH